MPHVTTTRSEEETKAMLKQSHLWIAGGVLGLASLLGCNQTTRHDVSSAQDKVTREKQKLDEAKRDEARTAQKPVINDSNRDTNRDVANHDRDADRAHDKVVKQEDRVRDAERNLQDKQQDLNTEQHRDMFLIDCKAAIDKANRAVEKLQTKKNAATDDEKRTIDRQIDDIKSRRDEVQKEINNIRTSDVKKWSEFKPAAQQAMDDLNKEIKDFT